MRGYNYTLATIRYLHYSFKFLKRDLVNGIMIGEAVYTGQHIRWSCKWYAT